MPDTAPPSHASQIAAVVSPSDSNCRLLGRKVLAPNNQPIGRLEEFRAEKRGNGLVITEYVIGMAGLRERLGVSLKLLFGKSTGGYVARWDQLDISDPLHPRLRCPASELRKEE